MPSLPTSEDSHHLIGQITSAIAHSYPYFILPTQVWEDITMDFITGLPPSASKTSFLVVVDRLTKYAHFCPLIPSFSSLKVAEVFAHNIFRLHGLPRSIMTDRNPLFVSNSWQELFRLQGTTLSISSAYHSHTDGQYEVLNRYLEMYLRSFVLDTPQQCVRFLPWAELWYNSSFHSTSAAMTPFKALDSRPPPILVRFVPDSIDNEALEHDLMTHDDMLRTLKINLTRAQSKMKVQVDKHHTDKLMEEGNLGRGILEEEICGGTLKQFY